MEILGQLGTSANSVAAVLVTLGLCIYFHEIGHFVVAKLANMRVDEFSFGFGPLAFGIRRGETLYSVRWIPVGGFVKIAGMEPGEREMERGFFSRPRILGAASILAGVAMNVLLAVGIYFALAMYGGVTVEGSTQIVFRRPMAGQPAAAAGLEPGDTLVSVDGETLSLMVTKVAPSSPAEAAGLKAGAQILQVGGEVVATPTDLVRLLQGEKENRARIGYIDPAKPDPFAPGAFAELQIPAALRRSAAPLPPDEATKLAREALGLEFAPMDATTIVRYVNARPGVPITISVLRDGAPVRIAVTPAAVNDRVLMLEESGRLSTPVARIGRIGVSLGPPVRPSTVSEAMHAAISSSVGAVALVAYSIPAMISRRVAAEPVGPVGIVAMVSKEAKQGWESVFSLTALISANLVVINLLPIPPFDGFWLVLIAFEAVTRRAVNQRVEIAARYVGVVVVLLLFVGFIAKDVYNLTMYGVP